MFTVDRRMGDPSKKALANTCFVQFGARGERDVVMDRVRAQLGGEKRAVKWDRKNDDKSVLELDGARTWWQRGGNLAIWKVEEIIWGKAPEATENVIAEYKASKARAR